MKQFEDDEVVQRIRPATRVAASNSFRERVMKAIVEEEARERSRSSWPLKRWPRWALAGCAAALLLLLIPLLPFGKNSVPGAALLAQSIEAMSDVKTVHLQGRIRTLPGDNFELIGMDYDFVPIEIWREFSNPPRWRIEKTGRVVVMNGQESLLYISQSNTAAKGAPGAGFAEWLRPMLDPQSILENELTAARQGKAQASVSESNGVITLTMRRSAQGDFVNDWARNKSIPESDHTCVYRFDSASKRLEGVEVTVSSQGRDVAVAEFSSFRYNETFPESLYALQLPPDVDWATGPNDTPAKVVFTTPREVAAFFFDALAKEDWDALLQVYPRNRVQEGVRRIYGGVKLLSLGEPFQSGLYRGYFVPYRIQLRSGQIKEHNVAVRNDNRAHRWHVDGGF